MPDRILQFRDEIIHRTDSFRHLYTELNVSIGGEVHEAANLLTYGRNVCLIGPAGSGKTTVLRWLAASVAESIDRLPPIFVSLRNAPEEFPLLSVRSFLEQCASPTPPSELLDKFASDASSIVILDGLDEILGKAQTGFGTAVDRWISEWPNSVWLLSTRPHFVGLVPDAFTIAKLLPLDDSLIEQYLANRQQSTKLASTISKLKHWPSLRILAHNPLLLDMLSRLSEEVGELPLSRTELYSSCVDLLMRSWDKERGITLGDRMSPEQIRRLMSEAAFKMTAAGRSSLVDSEVSEIIQKEQEGTEDASCMDQNLLRSAFLMKSESNSFEFVHKSFQEYFTALAIASRPDPTRVAAIADSASDTLLEFLANLSEGPEALVSELLNQGQFNVVIRLLDVLPSEQRILRLHFLSQVAQRLGLTDAISPASVVAVRRTIELSQLWGKCKNTTNPQLKGRYLEDFVEAVFSHVFAIVSKDRLTNYGEIDLICEQRELNAFWGRWPSDFFVECKNRMDKSPVSDINEFIGKASMCGSRLSFFVSMTGFTDFARNSMHASWWKPGVPDVVWVTGHDFEKWLASSKSVESFLKDLCRRANWKD